MRKQTLSAADREYLRAKLAQANRTWTVGMACKSYDFRTLTHIVRIEGEIVHCANGDHMHVSKMRQPSDNLR